jgi:hypothetical protein
MRLRRHTAHYSFGMDIFGGVGIVRKADGASVYLQPGDDANAFTDQINSRSIDEICAEYDDIMQREED